MSDNGYARYGLPGDTNDPTITLHQNTRVRANGYVLTIDCPIHLDRSAATPSINWTPIAEASEKTKDGRHCLLWWDGIACLGYFQSEAWRRKVGDMVLRCTPAPTHFAEIVPPKEAK